jgi:hypothetical protein
MENGKLPASPLSDVGLALLKEGKKNEGLGLTKREYFAGLALQGLMVQAIAGNHNINDKDNNHYRAKFAVDMADELLKQLES